MRGLHIFSRGTGRFSNRSRLGTFMIVVFLITVAAFTSLPLIYSVAQSLKPIEEIFAFPPRFMPKKPTAENFRLLFSLTGGLLVPFSRFVFNSMFVSVIGTGAYVIIASMAAYPLALGEFRAKKLINSLIVQALLFSSPVLAVSQYMLLAKGKMLDTYFAMILPALAAPLGLFLMRQFMMQMIPKALVEAAKIDGASNFGVFFKVVMPIVKPAWLTLIIFTFQSLWSGNGSNYIYSEQMKVLPTALGQLAAEGAARAGVGAAAAVLLLVPPVLTFLLTQRSVVETMASSGIKE